MNILVFGDSVAQRLDAMYRTADIVAQRAAILERLAPQLGEQVTDVGCGPGFLTRSLAEAVGSSGQVLGIDSSESMLAAAAGQCAGLPSVRLLLGDARELDLPSGVQDAVICSQVVEYIRTVDGAIAELFRLLRPGGRALIVDTDWRSLAWHSGDEGHMRRVLAAWENHCSYPSLPRTLATRLRRVGFVLETVEALPILNPALGEDTYSHELIDLVREYVLDRDLLEQSEVDDWAAELRELGTRGTYFFNLCRFLFVVRKPQGRQVRSDRA